MRYRSVCTLLFTALLTTSSLPVVAGTDAQFDKLYSSGKYRELIDYAEEKVPVANRDSDIWAKLGVANEEQGLIEKALACFMVAMRLDQKNYEAYLGAARVYNKMGQSEGALDMAKKAMEIKPTGEASWAFAQACITLNKVSEAKAALEKVCEMDPSNTVAQRALGNVLFKEKNYAKAVGYLKKAYAAKPDGETAMDLALAYKTIGNLDTAIIFYKEAFRDKKSGNPEAGLELGRIYYQKQQYGDVVETFGGVDQGTLSGQDLFNYATSIEKSGGSKDQMIKVYEAAIQKAGTGYVKEVLVAKEAIGRYSIEKKQYQKAVDALEYVRSKSGGDAKVNQEVLFLIAEAYDGMKNRASAIPLLEAVIARNSKNVEAYARLADLYTKENMADKAKTILEKLISLQPSNPEVFYSLGEYNYKAGNYSEALKLYQKSFTLDQKAQTAVGMMNAAWQAKMYDVARDAAETALHKDDKLKEPQVIIAKILFEEKNYSGAAEKYQYLLKADADNLEYLEQLAVCYDKLGSKDNLAEIDKKIISIDKKNVGARQRYANFAKESGDLKTAKEILDELIVIQPKNADLFRSLYDISVKTNNKKDATRYLKSYLALNTNDGKLHKELGDLLYDAGEKDAALESYRTALKKDPTVKGLYKRYAELVMSRKSSGKDEQQEVLTVLTNAVKAGEADGEIYATLGTIYKNQGVFQNAIDMYQKALQKDPKDIESLASLAFCQDKAGRTSEAIISYEQAAALTTTNADAYKSLGDLYLKSGKKDQAVNAYKSYIEKTPDDKLAIFIGDAALDKKQYDEAIKYYSLVRGSAAGEVSLIEKFSDATYASGDMKKSEELLKMLTVKTPDKMGPYQKLYEINLKNGNKKEAAVFLTKYTQLKPTDIQSLQALGDLQYELKNNSEAIAAYRGVLKGNPNAKGFYKRYLELTATLGTADEKVAALNGAVVAGEADAAAYEQLGNTYLTAKNYVKALQYLEKASSLDPKSISALKSVGVCQEKTGATAAAILTLEQVVALDATAKEELKTLGDLYLKQNKKENAVNYFKKYLENTANDEKALFVADYAYAKNNATEAVTYYNKVTDPKLQTPAFMLNYGKACVKAGDTDKALTAYKKLAGMSPEDPDVQKTLYDLLFQKNLKDESLVYLKKYVTLKPGDADAQKKLGDMLYLRGDKAGAIAAYQAALKADPKIRGFHKNFVELVVERGVEADIVFALSVAVASEEADIGMYKKLAAIYVNQKKFDLALPLFEKASAKEPQNVSLLADLAAAQAKGGNTAAAILTYEQVIALNPKAEAEYRELGNLYKAQKKNDQAVTNYKKYLEKKSDNVIALEIAQYNFGNKNYGESVKYFDMLTGSDASVPDVVKMYAEAALLSKDEAKALSLYKKVVAFEPANTDALKKLYQVSGRAGSADDVLYYLKKYVALKPADADAQKLLGDLLVDKKDSAGALAAYRAAYKADPRMRGYFKKFTTLLYPAGKDDEVLAVLNSAIEAGEADTDMYIRIGETYLKLKNYSKAISSLEKASQLDPKNTAVMTSLAQAQVASGNQSAAILTYEQVIAMNAAAENEFKELGNLYWQQKKTEQALSNYFKYLDKKQDNEIARLVGTELYKQKKYKDAARYFGMINGSDSNDPKQLMLYGEVLVLAKDDFKAYQVFRQLSNISTKDPVVFENLYKLAGKAGSKDDVMKYLKVYTALKPNDAKAQVALGNILVERNDEPAAIEAYRSASKADSTLKGFYKNYAVLVMKFGTDAEKYTVLARTIAAGEADAKMYQSLGEIYVKNGQFDKANSSFEKASQLDPKNDKLLSYLAESQLKKGDLRQAAMTYEQVVAMNPRVESEFKTLGSIYMKLGKDSLGMLNYKKYLDKKPTDSDVAFEVAGAALKDGKFTDAKKYLGMVRGKRESSVEFVRMYGDASYETKDYSQALIQYGKLVKLIPKDASVYKRLYEINMKTGAKSDALSNLRTYAAFATNDADAQKNLGNMLYEQGDKVNALAAYRKALTADPKIKDIYKNYVKLVLVYGKYDEKQAALDGAIAAGEADASVYQNAGDLYVTAKNYKKAIELYTEAVKLDPKDFESYTALSRCLLNVNDITSAAIYLEKALKANPSAKKEYKDLGDLYMKQKLNAEAIAAYTTYLDKVTNDEEVAKVVADYYYNAKKYADAYKYYGMVKNDNSATFNISYGLSALYAKDYPGSILILEKVRVSSEKISNRDVAYKALAEAYESHRKPEKAVEVLYDYIKLPGVKDPDAAYRIAAVYEAIDLNKAVQMYKENITTYPKDYRNYVKLGFYYSKMKGSEKNAMAYLQRAVKIADTLSDVWLELGTLYSRTGRSEEMLNAYRKYIEVEPNNVQIQARIGEELLAKGMVEDAMVFLEMANAQEENNPKYMTLLARGYLMTDRQKEGVRLIEKVIKAAKGSIDDDLRMTLTDVYIETQDYTKAINELKEIMKTNTSTKVQTKYAKALIASGKVADALKIAEQIKAKEPENIDIHMMIGEIKVIQKKYNDAIETYKEILYVDQNYAPALCERANVYLLQGKLQWAQTFYDRALKVDPNNALVYLGLARLSKEKKDYATYAEMLEKARKLAPQNREIQAELRSAR